MAKYFLNRDAQSNGNHEVHKEGCLLPGGGAFGIQVVGIRCFI